MKKMIRHYRWLFTIGFMLVAASAFSDDRFSEDRRRMVEQDLKGRDITDSAVLDAMKSVKRHLFVPESMTSYAYADRPIPIGFSQTISQPYIVALMSQLLEAEPGMKVLEIGTGSGYQAAVLNEMGLEVYSIEIISALAKRSKRLFSKMDLPIEVLNTDGYYGWPEKAPFDRIIITAAANHVPRPLIDQLKPGGRLILPLGKINLFQTLTVIEKDEKGETRFSYHIGVRFVPMTGKMLE